MGRVALVTGVGRRQGLGFAISQALAADGWDVGFLWWGAYDARGSGADAETAGAVAAAVQARGGRSHGIEVDLADPAAPAAALSEVAEALGPVSALVVSHCECAAADTLSTTVASLDRHYAVNVRATWLLVRAFAEQFPDGRPGRVVTLTSDDVSNNLAYGATKAAADRVTKAAAVDLGPRGITANALNPGPVDTGWMDEALRAEVAAATALPRAATPADVAELVRWLCSDAGGWVTGQLLHCDGGFASTLP